MQLEQQVSSLELSKKLKSLGVKQESTFYWHDLWNGPSGGPYKLMQDKRDHTDYSAFTVAELGEMLPHTHTTYKSELGHYVCHSNQSLDLQKAETEANARAKCLIHLIENGIVKP